MDEQGNMVDDKGNILKIEKPTELKVNKRNQKEDKSKEQFKFNRFNKTQQNELLHKRKFYDSSIETNNSKREKKRTGAFNFV